MKRGRIVAFFLLAAALLLAACAPKEAPAPAPQPVAPAPRVEVAAPAPAAPAKAAWEEQWTSLVAAAKKEGKVSVFTNIGVVMRTEILPVFRGRYGVSIEAVAGRDPELIAKIMAERRAGLFTVDVYNSGVTPILNSLKPEGILEPLDPVLLYPETIDPKAWYFGELLFIDKERTILAFGAGPSPALLVNTDMVKPGEINSYRDLLNPKWKGKILLNPPHMPGIGSKWYGTVSTKLMSLDYMKELAKQELVIIDDQRLQVEWVARGKYPILIAPKSEPFAEFWKAGAPVKVITPAEGVHLSAASGSLALLSKAPHPNAARLFINWLLSREGQTLFSKGSTIQSGRVDVPTDFLPPGKVREPGVKYVWADTAEDLKLAPQRYKEAEEIFRASIKH